jgi:RNA polymerase sigma factor (sigma-70 family)
LEARDQERVQARLALAFGLARRQFWLCAQLMPLAELNGEACLALADAASRYREEYNIPFGAYATLVIRHRLLQAFTEWYREGRLAFTCFSDLIAQEGKTGPLAFDLPCRQPREPWQEVHAQDVIEQLRQKLPPQWFEILDLVYLHGYTLRQVGEMRGLKRDRVKRIVRKALERARKLWKRDKISA